MQLWPIKKYVVPFHLPLMHVRHSRICASVTDEQSSPELVQSLHFSLPDVFFLSGLSVCASAGGDP